jgi:hypothetical protein
MNYKFPGAEKMPWEIAPELMRAIYPQGAPNPFIPGAGSDDPAYAATYPEGQGARGFMPGEHDWKRDMQRDALKKTAKKYLPPAVLGQVGNWQKQLPPDWQKNARRWGMPDFQPAVHRFEPPPQKTTDKRSWTHAPPEKNWSYNPPEKKWSTEDSWEGPLNQVNEQQIQDFVKAFMNKP